MSRNDTVEIEAELRHETDAAFLIYDGSEEVWLPKSQVEYDGKGTFILPEWLAQKHGLI